MDWDRDKDINKLKVSKVGMVISQQRIEFLNCIGLFREGKHFLSDRNLTSDAEYLIIPALVH